jgi:hypothetical protein
MTTDAGAGGPGARPDPRPDPRPETLPAPANRTMRAQRLVNLLVRGLLRTPGLSRIIGARLVTLYVVGRRSRQRYPVPVAYLAQGDDLLIGTSSGWVRNLRTGEPVAIRLRGRHCRADVRIHTAESEVVPAYADMARANPTFASFNGIRLGEDGEPNRDDLRSAWQSGARALRLTPSTKAAPAGR